MSDRRRINGPSGSTAAPIFAIPTNSISKLTPSRTRKAKQLRKIFLQTGLTPPASGSAYLELQHPQSSIELGFLPQITTRPSLKLTCAVHFPRPLPRTAPFSPQLVLSTTVKFATFASRERRGFVRDAFERDLGVHLETALRGVIIAERYSKSALEVIVTVIEAEEHEILTDSGATASGAAKEYAMMTVLAGCITVASAAIADAGVDCVDLVSGGVAALVRNGDSSSQLVLDPCPPEHSEVVAACVVGYLKARDEITEVWMRGNIGEESGNLLDAAVEAASASRTVLEAAVKEGVDAPKLGK